MQFHVETHDCYYTIEAIRMEIDGRVVRFINYVNGQQTTVDAIYGWITCGIVGSKAIVAIEVKDQKEG